MQSAFVTMKRIRAHLTGSLQVSISAYRKDAGTWKSTTRKAGDKSLHIGTGGNNMTIDEAIAKYKEITNTDANCPAHCNISCDKCVQESKQLVEWLEELKALREYKERMEMQYLDDIDNPLEPLKLQSALQSEIFKFNYRKEHKPQDINILDYTIMYALKHCLAEQLKAGASNENNS